jgi:putative ABC transport system substrate-binding protein
MKTGKKGGPHRRRDLLELCAGAFLATSAWPVAARAQQPAKLWRVGWIWSGRSAGNPPEAAGFRQGMKELGYIEGRNIIVDYRFGEGQIERIPDLVAELLQLRPDVMVALGDRVARNVNTTIPVVVMSSDPIGTGLVTSLARPGGNVTGVSMMQGLEGLTGKRIQLLKDAVPAATRIGFMFNPDAATAVTDLGQAKEVASRLGVVLRPSPVRRSDEIEMAIAALARDRVDGLCIPPQLPFVSYPRETGELLLKYRVPAISELRQIAESGGLLSYGPNLFDATRRLAYFVDRILKGATPAETPAQQPTRFELVINLKLARAIGVEIPPSIFARADELIE